jgi:hypothetical protein
MAELMAEWKAGHSAAKSAGTRAGHSAAKKVVWMAVQTAVLMADWTVACLVEYWAYSTAGKKVGQSV